MAFQKSKSNAAKARRLRATTRGKGFYTGFAENVREYYIPRFVDIDALAHGIKGGEKKAPTSRDT